MTQGDDRQRSRRVGPSLALVASVAVIWMAISGYLVHAGDRFAPVGEVPTYASPARPMASPAGAPLLPPRALAQLAGPGTLDLPSGDRGAPAGSTPPPSPPRPAAPLPVDAVLVSTQPGPSQPGLSAPFSSGLVDLPPTKTMPPHAGTAPSRESPCRKHKPAGATRCAG